MKIYTAYATNAKAKGGCGFVVDINSKIDIAYAKSKERTTNNQMALQALYSALQYVKKIKIKNLDVYSPSNYAVNGYLRWTPMWSKNDWLTPNGETPANIKHWQKLLKIKKELEELKLTPNLHLGFEGSNSEEFIDNLVKKIIKK